MDGKEGTKSRALREARGLLQLFGFNGFSFQHVADLLGIKKPSLYDHFESKEKLGLAIIEEYRVSFELWMDTVEVFGPKEKVGALFELFYQFSTDNRKICPLTAFTADYNSLPKALKKPLSKMLDVRFQWLKKVIEQGKKEKTFGSKVSSSELARVILSIGLGAQLMARVSRDPGEIRTLKDQIFKLLD